MLDILKNHGHELAQSIFEVKAATGATLSALGAVTVAVVDPAPVALGLHEWSTIAVIFSATATGVFMASNFVLNLIKIRRKLKQDDED